MRRSERDSRSHECSDRRGRSVHVWACALLFASACAGTEVLDKPHEPPVWPIRSSGAEAETPTADMPEPVAERDEAPELEDAPEPAPTDDPNPPQEAPAAEAEPDESTEAADDPAPPTEEHP